MGDTIHHLVSGISIEDAAHFSKTVGVMRLPHLLSNQDFVWSDEQLDKIQAFRAAHADKLICSPRKSQEEFSGSVGVNGECDTDAGLNLDQNSKAEISTASTGPMSSIKNGSPVAITYDAKGDDGIVTESLPVMDIAGPMESPEKELREEGVSGLQVANPESSSPDLPRADPRMPTSQSSVQATSKTKKESRNQFGETSADSAQAKKRDTLPGFGHCFRLSETEAGMSLQRAGQCPAAQNTAFADDNVPFEAVSVPCRPFTSQARKIYRAPSRRERNMRVAHEGNSMSLQAYLEAHDTARSLRLYCNSGAKLGAGRCLQARDAELRLSGSAFYPLPDKWKFFSKQWNAARETNRRSFSANSKVHALTPSPHLLETEVTSFFGLAVADPSNQH
eukprot:gnl/MRDRNA2_/MRDRNA2_140920_c0_seq1.p1 gnl/MRDRNA2_/MRDRNA2_140920_c0~~gnl/MRDRNA2_/MRDRNA2_140920_c0_seq1.p1  ORF type:complete len:392 (+),score=49.99 gnl/MRDRNA2_/MRDRNA2_140920_c0_seq1:141-1316(+)